MKSPSLTRREFLQSTAFVSTGAAFAHILPAPLQPPATKFETAPAWASRAHRWAQLTLVEDDPIHFDPAFWLDYFKRTHSDAVCLSGGGCVAYYPTEIPFHHRSPWLGDSDVLGDLITGCRRLNMTVVVRTDPHATWDDTQAAHPDWIAVTADGKPRRHWAAPDMWVTCAYGPYNFQFMTDVHKEIMQRYKCDGIFMNRWNGSGDCFCVHCTHDFKAATGYDLPRTNDPQDPVHRACFLWRQQRMMDALDLWNSEIRRINPDSAIIPNNGSGAMSPLNSVVTSQRSPMLAADRQARQGLAAPWLIGKTAKEYRATMGAKPIIGLFGVGLEEPYRWKDSVTSNAEIRIWVLDAVANGMRPWFSKFSGTLHDERWLKGVEDIYLWTDKNQPYLTFQQPLARVALVYSQQTAWFYGGPHAQAKVEDHALGWYQALIESRIQFEMLDDQLLDPAHLAPFKTLILPNLAALSDAQCNQLRAFVKAGGSIVATHETSLYDEHGARRSNFGLSDLFGVDADGPVQGPVHNSYIRLEHEKYPRHQLFTGLEDAPRIINGVNQVPVKPRATFAETPLTLIPSYPDLPMEMVFPRVPRTDTSCLYLNQPAGTPGRVAYIPFDLDRTFWEVLNDDHLKLLRNTLLWATNEPPQLEVTGPGLIDATLWRNPGSITVHMVNLTNPMTMKGPYRDFFPIGPQTIHLRLPNTTHAQQAKLLVADRTIPIDRSGDTLTLTVPSILDHEVVAIEI